MYKLLSPRVARMLAIGYFLLATAATVTGCMLLWRNFS